MKYITEEFIIERFEQNRRFQTFMIACMFFVGFWIVGSQMFFALSKLWLYLTLFFMSMFMYVMFAIIFIFAFLGRKKKHDIGKENRRRI